jgi:acetylornithine deacetylase
MTTRLERVWQAISPERLRSLFMNMLDIYSPSGKEEDIQLYLEQVLASTGFRVTRQEVEEDRYNLLATIGAKTPQLYLVGHVDTVPAWDLEEFGAQDDGNVITGLGSADMKGGCAAMIESVLAIGEALPEEERPSIGLLLVVGEEENGDGSKAFLQTHHPAWVVIGEPTGLAACFTHFGYLEAGFVTRGKRSHSSLPELGHNAVESMLKVLLHLGKEPIFDREQSELVYSIREMRSSRAGFVVPDLCEAWIDLHLPPDKDPLLIQDIIRASTANIGQFIPGLDLEVSFDFAANGYDLGTANLLADILKTIYPQMGLELRLDAFRSHSDGNLFNACDIHPLILGPGALETAHTHHEHVIFDEVVAAARIYAALCLGAG